MKLNELEYKYKTAYKAIRRELQARQFVYRDDPEKLAHKLQEMQEVLIILTELKDALKPYCESAEQPRLLDVPKRDAYP